MEKIGRYINISELGRGGMATVYQATDPRFERSVAIKVLPQALLHDPQFRVRFEREAKMIAALEHSSIVPVYDFGEQDGQPYIVMRLMSGGSLADKLKDGKFNVDEAARVIIRVASALDVAHQKGIIHRDLKPGNILFDQYDNAYLSDFGIARLTKGSVTLTGSNVLGTPAYMSPEQVQGDKDIDGRSDIYALGVIFYQMLVGNTPYHATTPAKVMMMHILEPVPSLMKQLPDVSPEVEAWFEKALAKEPDERFSTASEMAAELDTAVRGLMVSGENTVITGQSKTQIGRTVMTPPPRARAENPPSGTPPIIPPAGIPFADDSDQALSRPRLLPAAIIGIIIFGIITIGLIVALFLGISGSGPLAMLAPATATPSNSLVANIPVEPDLLDTPSNTTIIAPTSTPTFILPSETAEPTIDEVDFTATVETTATIPSLTDTPEPTFSATPDVFVVGGADKIAFIDDNEIWVMNVDGSDLTQITNDRAEKYRLEWTPDGNAVTYISGKCIWAAEFETGRLDHIACFESAKFIDDFTISSDGTQVAISLNFELFVTPYDRDRLAQARSRTDLIAMSECEVLAPLKTSTGASVAVSQVKWSNDDTRLAIKVKAPEGGIQVDLIRFMDISNCQYADLLDEFPATRFDIDGYNKTPYIQNFAYDGDFLFSMVSYTRNDGYGHMYLYNTNLHRAENKVNPVDGNCCYRDPRFSPDGRYLIFAYQPFEAGATTQLYYVLFASLGSGGNIEPIPLPETFFTEPKVKPQPAFRPAIRQ